MKSFIEIQNIAKTFGGLKALNELSFSVKKGQIYGLIGPNGSGKSTLLKIISGIISPDSGQIILEGRNIIGEKRHHLPNLGIAQVLQGGSLFQSQSVIDNIMLGMHSSFNGGLLSFLIKPLKTNKQERKIYQKALYYLDFVGIDHKYRSMPIMETPYAVQRHIELARAIASDPRLLLLDEPVAGLNTVESKQFQHLIEKIREKNVTILLVEHDMKFISGITDEITVLNFGQKIAEGSYCDITNNPEVIEAYLGKGIQ